MATHTATSPDDFSFPQTKLTANVEDRLEFKTSFEEIEVTSDGVEALYFTVDGSPPKIGGAQSHRLPRVPSTRTVEVPGGGNTVVRLISEGTPTYSVQRP